MKHSDEHDGRYQLPLYVTEGEIIKHMGVGIHSGRKAIQEMKKHPQFPPKTIGGKYYWGSIKDFLDVWNGRKTSVREDPEKTPPWRGRAWANLEAAQERVARRLALATAKEEGIDPRVIAVMEADPELGAYLKRESERMAEGGKWRPTLEASAISLAISRARQTVEKADAPAQKRKLTPRAPPTSKDGV